MMMVPGASVVRYSTMVRLNSGSSSTESSARSPGWSPGSFCCAKLGDAESIKPAVAIKLQIRCLKVTIDSAPVISVAVPTVPPRVGTINHANHAIAIGKQCLARADPEPQSISDNGERADAAEPERCEPQQPVQQRRRFLRRRGSQ